MRRTAIVPEVIPTALRVAAFAGLAVAVLALVPAAALAQTELIGNTPGGAFYRIRVPATWNGQLVIWSHGFDLSEPRLDPDQDLGPLVDVHLAEGYAVASTSYRQAGWALFKTVPDLQELMAVFRRDVGEPAQIFLYGASLGGLVTQQAVEQAGLGNVAGALIWCGAVAGSRNWDAAIDLRLAYDAVCRDVPGAAIPGGAFGLPAKSNIGPLAVALAVNVCTGVDLVPRSRSAAQQARLDQLIAAVGVDESFLQIDMWYVTFGMADLDHDGGKMNGKLGTDNRRVVYPDAEVDAAIERVTARAGKKRRLQRNYTPTGNVGATRIVALHTDKDGLAVVENLGDLQSKVPAERLVAAVAIEETPSHCGFTEAEALASWESLRSWVGDDTPPTAASIQSRCQLYEVLVGAEGPCRIDPDFVIGSIDDRILPRQ